MYKQFAHPHPIHITTSQHRWVKAQWREPVSTSWVLSPTLPASILTLSLHQRWLPARRCPSPPWWSRQWYSGGLLWRLWPLHAPILLLDGRPPQRPQRCRHHHHLQRGHLDQLQERKSALEGRVQDYRHLPVRRLLGRIHPCSRFLSLSCLSARACWSRYVMVCTSMVIVILISMVIVILIVNIMIIVIRIIVITMGTPWSW